MARYAWLRNEKCFQERVDFRKLIMEPITEIIAKSNILV